MLSAKQAYFAVRTTIFSPAILDVENDRELGQVKKRFQRRGRRVKLEMGEGRPAPSVLSRPRSMYLWGFSQKNKQTNKQKTYNRYVVLC